MGTERSKNMTIVKKDTVIMYSNDSNIIITWQLLLQKNENKRKKEKKFKRLNERERVSNS